MISLKWKLKFVYPGKWLAFPPLLGDGGRNEDKEEKEERGEELHSEIRSPGTQPPKNKLTPQTSLKKESLKEMFQTKEYRGEQYITSVNLKAPKKYDDSNWIVIKKKQAAEQSTVSLI